jgi:hypothetical protein
MSIRLLSCERMRRRILVLALPVCMGLILAGMPSATMSRASAQAPERIKAPEFDGATDFLGSDKPIKLKDLRGKIVVLDFWTLC